MADAPRFFVPAATPDTQESRYRELANQCHSAILPLEKRIYSITFVHDGEEWSATVGQTLRGMRRRVTRSRGKKIERKVLLSDSATVLAIFPEAPFQVVTDHGIAANIRSAWENPLLVGKPTSITYFSTNS